MTIHDDYYDHYGVENLKIDGIYVGISDPEHEKQRIPMEKFMLRGWGKHPAYRERLKQSYYIMQELWGG